MASAAVKFILLAPPYFQYGIQVFKSYMPFGILFPCSCPFFSHWVWNKYSFENLTNKEACWPGEGFLQLSSRYRAVFGRATSFYHQHYPPFVEVIKLFHSHFLLYLLFIRLPSSSSTFLPHPLPHLSNS